MQKVYIVVPNWNGAKFIAPCLDSLLNQSIKATIVVPDNNSSDNSRELIETKYPKVTLLSLKKNHGFAGGVNAGIKHAMEQGADFIALFNNDAVADKVWLTKLVSELENNKKLGIATGKLLDARGTHIDSTGDQYTTWGLPYPRGRGEETSTKYDEDTTIFAASGGASIYRVKMLETIGIFDEDFFAYYEDVDLSFRAQLAGWKVSYVPDAIAYHKTGSTSSSISGFTTYQTMKNLPLLFWKNVPWRLVPTIWPRLTLAYWSFLISAVSRGQGWPATRGLLSAFVLIPKKLVQRHKIQKNRKVSPTYIKGLLTYDLPPNARKLRGVRSVWRHTAGRVMG